MDEMEFQQTVLEQFRNIDERLQQIDERLDRIELTGQALVTATTDLLRCHQSPVARDIERNLDRDLAKVGSTRRVTG